MSIEEEIQEKGLNAPRITPESLKQSIHSVHYFTAEEGQLGAYKLGGDVYQGGMPDDVNSVALKLLTICVVVLKNGFTVTGESACASPENFDSEIGRKIALQNAESKIWPLLGYELKQKLSEGKA